jgi:hypothetical protein
LRKEYEKDARVACGRQAAEAAFSIRRTPATQTLKGVPGVPLTWVRLRPCAAHI